MKAPFYENFEEDLVRSMRYFIRDYKGTVHEKGVRPTIDQVRNDVRSNFHLLSAASIDIKEKVMYILLHRVLSDDLSEREASLIITWLRKWKYGDYLDVIPPTVMLAKLLVFDPKTRHDPDVLYQIDKIRKAMMDFKDEYDRLKVPLWITREILPSR